MKFYKDLYFGESVKHIGRIKRRLKTGAGQFSIYVIILSNDSKRLEIMNSAYLQQSYYRRNPVFIIGITNSYEEAISIILKITQETMDALGKPDLLEYLKRRMK